MNGRIQTAAWAVLLLLLISGNASAAPTKVLIVAADYDAPSIQAYLGAYPGLSPVDIFNAVAGTPTLGQLQGYDAVLVYSNYPFSDKVALGDVLADYVDGGGRVVISTFSFYGPSYDLSGRIITDGYSPLVQAGGSPYSTGNLGWYDPGNPIMSGVSALSGYFRDDTALASGATLVAKWDDDKPLVAVKGNVVGITLFPPTDYGSVDWTGDFPMLLHNSLVISGQTANVPEFPTVALPVIAVISLVYLFQRRRDN